MLSEMSEDEKYQVVSLILMVSQMVFFFGLQRNQRKCQEKRQNLYGDGSWVISGRRILGTTSEGRNQIRFKNEQRSKEIKTN